MPDVCDKSGQRPGWRTSNPALWLMAGILLLTGCAPRSTWEEEVTIAPGETVIVERGAKFASTGSIGGVQSSFTTRQQLRVKLPSGPTADWVSGPIDTPGVGETTFRPIYLQRDESGHLFLVTSFYFCETWVTVGRPSPPYLAFRWTGTTWESASVPTGFWGKTANLLLGPGKNTGVRLSTATIQQMNRFAYEFDASLVNSPIAPACSDVAQDTGVNFGDLP